MDGVIYSTLIALFIALFSNKIASLGDLLSIKIKKHLHPKSFKNRKKLLKAVNNPHVITWAIVRAYSFLLIFIVSFGAYILLSTFGPLRALNEASISIQLLFASPIFAIEALWLIQKEKAKYLVNISTRKKIFKKRKMK